jgi:hypothetical protein
MELDPDHDPEEMWTPWRRLWWGLRAGLLFLLAILAILGITWLLEPQCCEHMNNYSGMFRIQLKYPNGPPPV